MNIKKRVAELVTDLVELRRDFHRHPELGFEEYRTQEKVMEYLQALGLNARPVAGTGVVALLEGAQAGPTVMLRSDMDALPVAEQTGLPFASHTEGKMHACGHDGHMAMLLVAARVLTEMRNNLSGNIKFAFQPNEEEAGAYKMIEDGILENPGVNSAFGIHLWSQCPSGTVDIVSGPQMAASYYFFLTIHGKGGHAGFVHESVDPILVATNIVQSVQAIQTREVNALDPAVVMFTSFHAGTSATIVPEKVELSGSIRFLFEGGEELMERFKRIVNLTCQAHQVQCELRFERGNRLLFNDPAITERVRAAAEETLTDAHKVTATVRTMAGEDFSDYIQTIPGAFAFVGSANPKRKSDFPHHHPRFTIDEDVLPIGTELHVRAALRLLGQT